MDQLKLDEVQLMERAVEAVLDVVLDWMDEHEANLDFSKPICIACGPGNNGGDGYALARLLQTARPHYKVVTTSLLSSKRSFACAEMRDRWLEMGEEWRIQSADLGSTCLLIDALFGTGRSQPLQSLWLESVLTINALPVPILSLDLPSGLPADGPLEEGATAIQADATVVIGAMKPCLLLPENEAYTGHELLFADFGLQIPSSPKAGFYVHYAQQLPVAPRFAHKGTQGHVLVLAGSHGKAGAALLSTLAALHSGAGLVSVGVPACALNVVQLGAPEAMCLPGLGEWELEQLPNLAPYDAIAIGPGLGQSEASSKLVQQVIANSQVPVVVDADALNVLVGHLEWMHTRHCDVVLTPHPKEFDRLFGPHENVLHRMETARAMANEFGIHIVLKGAFSCTTSPNGQQTLNPSGYPGMAVGGMGDVLTGFVAGRLAVQAKHLHQVVASAVFLHGIAGEFCAEEAAAFTAGDVARRLGLALCYNQY